jgi:hypothetical protein
MVKPQGDIELIEIAAQAICDTHANRSSRGHPWSELLRTLREEYRQEARAAFRAAREYSDCKLALSYSDKRVALSDQKLLKRPAMVAGRKYRSSEMGSNMKAGEIAGYVKADGYRYIEIDGVEYKACDLAWLYVYGVWPIGEIEHINGERDDDRIANLRDTGAVSVREPERGDDR